MPVQILPTPSQPDWGAQFLGGFQQGMAMPEKLQNLRKGQLEMEAEQLRMKYMGQVMDEMKTRMDRETEKSAYDVGTLRPLQLRQLTTALEVLEDERDNLVKKHAWEEEERGAQRDVWAFDKKMRAQQELDWVETETRSARQAVVDVMKLFSEQGNALSPEVIDEISKNVIDPVTGKIVNAAGMIKSLRDVAAGPVATAERALKERERLAGVTYREAEAGRVKEQAAKLAEETAGLKKAREEGKPAKPATFSEKVRSDQEILNEAVRQSVMAPKQRKIGTLESWRKGVPKQEEVKELFEISDISIDILRHSSRLPNFNALSETDQQKVYDAFAEYSALSDAEKKEYRKRMSPRLFKVIIELEMLEKWARASVAGEVASGQRKLESIGGYRPLVPMEAQ